MLKGGDEKLSQKVYFNQRMERLESSDGAIYYAQRISESAHSFVFKTYFLTGELKMEGNYKDPEMKIAHGEFKYFYISGQLESEGEYREGYKYGIWTRYKADGSPKPEKIYACKAMLTAVQKVK